MLRPVTLVGAVAMSCGLEVAAALRMEEARGVDPIFRAVNGIDEGTAMEARLRWWRGVDPVAARWGAGLVVAVPALAPRYCGRNGVGSGHAIACRDSDPPRADARR